MSSKAQRLRAIADKVAADIVRLEKEIEDRRRHLAQAKVRALAAKPNGLPSSAPSWFAVWSRHAPPLARAVGQLDRARQRLPGAKDRAAEAKLHETAKNRIRTANAAMIARIDARADQAVTPRWNKERREEEKRIRKLKKLHAKRAAMGEPDESEKPPWARKLKKLPPPIKQPDPADLEIAIDLPRPGLVGYTPCRQPLVDAPPLPKAWTAAHVGVRLIEAHKVLMRLPASIWPKGFGAAWPLYKTEASEEQDLDRRPRLAPSAEAVARMNEAVCWPLQFLSNRPGAAADLNEWAMEAAWGQMDFDARAAPWTSLQLIATALNAEKAPIL